MVAPAAEAGVRAGDIVVAAGDDAVHTAEDLVEAVRQADPGDDLDLAVVRNGDETTITATLGNRPTPGNDG